MKLTREQISEMVKLVNQGEKVSDVAKEFGVRVQTVYYHLNKRNPERIHSESERHKKAIEKRKEAIRLYKKGISTKEIANILGIKESTVRYYLHGSLSSRGRRKRVTDEKIETIKYLVKVGHTLDDIARLYNINKNTIRRRLDEYALKHPDDEVVKLLTINSRGKGNMKKKIVDLYIQGKNNMEIAKELGVNLFIVNKVIKKLREGSI